MLPSARFYGKGFFLDELTALEGRGGNGNGANELSVGMVLVSNLEEEVIAKVADLRKKIHIDSSLALFSIIHKTCKSTSTLKSSFHSGLSELSITLVFTNLALPIRTSTNASVTSFYN